MKTIVLVNRSQEVADREMDKLFDELVPFEGKAATKAGEIVRAMCRLGYRFFNDGDQLGLDYGKETCNCAGRYLCEVLPGHAVKIIDYMWCRCQYNKAAYEESLLELENYVIDYLLASPELRAEPNADDYLNWYDVDEDQERWDDEDEDEVWEEDEEEGEDW